MLSRVLAVVLACDALACSTPRTSDDCVIAAGDAHTCLRKRDGSLYCWGWNGWLALGVTTTETCPNARITTPHDCSRSPLRLDQFSNDVLTVSAGASATCIVTTSNEVWCWGNDGEQPSGPRQIGMPDGEVDQIRVSELTRGARIGGHVYTWGGDCFGSLGRLPAGPLGSVGLVELPEPVVDLSAIVSCEACAAIGDGSLWCWGEGAATTNCADPGTFAVPCSRVPVLLPGYLVSSIPLPSCLVAQSDGRLWCGGVRIEALADPVREVSAGGNGTCAITNAGVLSCLGDKDPFTGRISVNEVAPNVLHVAVGGGHTCFVKADDSVWCWGDDSSGQLGVTLPTQDCHDSNGNVSYECSPTPIRVPINCR